MGDVAQTELIKLSGRDAELRAWISKSTFLIAMRGTIAPNDFSSPTCTKGGEGKVEFQEYFARDHYPFKEVACHDYTCSSPVPKLITARTPARPALHFVPTSHHSTL